MNEGRNLGSLLEKLATHLWFTEKIKIGFYRNEEAEWEM